MLPSLSHCHLVSSTSLSAGTQLLQDAGFSASAAILANTANGLFSVLGITVGILIMNKIDRRVMLLAGFSLTTIFHLLVGASALLIPDGTAYKPYVILVFVVLFVFSMQGTIGPLVWLLLSEIFSLKIRSFAMGVCVFALWIANAAYGFPPVVAALGISSSFFIFAACGVAAIVFIYKVVPETRGRTLEQFEDEVPRRPRLSPLTLQLEKGTTHHVRPRCRPRERRGSGGPHGRAAEAKLLDTDLIVFKRRTPIGKAVLGSISQRLLLESPVPVVAVKTGQAS